MIQLVRLPLDGFASPAFLDWNPIIWDGGDRVFLTVDADAR